MKELYEIIAAYESYQAQSVPCALATVVDVNGSAYRRPGARMLVSYDGQLTGAISGGCLEGDAMRKSQYAISKKSASLVVYDTMDEDDAVIGVGLGCNGIIKILIEPIDFADATNPIELLKMGLSQRIPFVMVTSFQANSHSTPWGTVGIIRGGQNQFRTDLPSGLTETALMRASEEVFQSQKSKTLSFEENPDLRIYFEYVPPIPKLLIVGAGRDAEPLARMAMELGWETSIVDGRATHADGKRFVGACQIWVAKPHQVFDRYEVDDRTYMVLLTHNFNYDKAMLLEWSKTPSPYIGMIGPKKKLIRALEELADAGTPIPEDRTEQIFGPTGLDLGAETSEEIALSILSEILAVMRKKKPIMLREKAGPIHEQV